MQSILSNFATAKRRMEEGSSSADATTFDVSKVFSTLLGTISTYEHTLLSKAENFAVG